MIQHRPRAHVRRFDWFKAIVATAVTLLVLVLLLQLPIPSESADEATTGDGAAVESPPATPAAAGSAAAGTDADSAATSMEETASVPSEQDAAAGEPLFRSVRLPQRAQEGFVPGTYPFSGSWAEVWSVTRSGTTPRFTSSGSTSAQLPTSPTERASPRSLASMTHPRASSRSSVDRSQ